jgi:Zn-dependent protease with chaperone function
MNAWLSLLWLVFALASMAWLISAALTPLVLAWLLRVESDAATRSRRILLVAALPWLVPVSLVLAVGFTAGSKAIGLVTDHCPDHGPGHPHLCFAHLPAIELGLIHNATAGLAAAVIIGTLWQLLSLERRALRHVGVLKSLAPSRRPLRVVRTAAPLAAASGIVKPVVLISRGLMDQLNFRERRIVVSHEVAHIRHRDALRNLLFEVLLPGHLPWVRHRLRAHWRQAVEEQADDTVAERFGVENVVATLVHVARINLHATPAGLSIAGADPVRRGRRLLSLRERAASQKPAFEVGYASALLVIFLGAVAGHHALETVLGLITGH